MVDANNDLLSIRQQCELLSVNRSNFYYVPNPRQIDTLLANEIHEIYLDKPYYGYRRITAALKRLGYKDVYDNKVLGLMQAMNLQALYPKPKTTVRNSEHKKYPYLLGGLIINRPNQVWATDITYIKMGSGFMYLAALIDIFSRFVIQWMLSNTLDAQFCLTMLNRAFKLGRPEILNTDQGCQFTSKDWTNTVEGHGSRVSMDGKGRWVDNIIIERFWRTIKHEHILVHDFKDPRELNSSIGSYIDIYNNERLHQSLGYNTPAEVYSGNLIII